MDRTVRQHAVYGPVLSDKGCEQLTEPAAMEGEAPAALHLQSADLVRLALERLSLCSRQSLATVSTTWRDVCCGAASRIGLWDQQRVVVREGRRWTSLSRTSWKYRVDGAAVRGDGGGDDDEARGDGPEAALFLKVPQLCGVLSLCAAHGLPLRSIDLSGCTKAIGCRCVLSMCKGVVGLPVFCRPPLHASFLAAKTRNIRFGPGLLSPHCGFRSGRRRCGRRDALCGAEPERPPGGTEPQRLPQADDLVRGGLGGSGGPEP